MSFLSPLLLLGLPLALVPVIIHLIHLLRRRQVKWAAMLFLRKAQKMHKGLSKLRQYLILAFRILAILALVLTIARPLAGGLLGLTGGAPDTAIILLDRSASMEEQLLSTTSSKRQAGLRNLSAAIQDAYGGRTRLVMVDSATRKPLLLENAKALIDLPQTGPTDTAADIPSLMQAALDYLSANETGRTDIWLVSDLRQTDWDPQGGRWTALRAAFSSLQGVRFHLLAYPEQPVSDLGVVVAEVDRRAESEGAQLLLDVRIQGNRRPTPETTIPLRVTVDGTTSTIEVGMTGTQTLLRALRIPIDKATERGWGHVELPADAAPANNRFHFVFDTPAPLNSAIVTADGSVAIPLQAALSAPANPARTYRTTVLSPERSAEIVWEETGLIVWQSALPDPESALAKQLDAHLRRGRALLFLPPARPSAHAFAGVAWSQWQEPESATQIEWWRSDAGLLGVTRAGTALPVGEAEIQRWCGLEGETIPLARLGDSAGRAPLLVQSLSADGHPGAHFLATLPGPGFSSLARDGVVLYALLHRALEAGCASLGNAQQRDAGSGSLGEALSDWKRVNSDATDDLPAVRALRAGIFQQVSGPVQIALNRPLSEDDRVTLDEPTLGELFAGLDWRLLERTLQNEKSLTSEVWRTFLLIMAAAILLEALLCLPRNRVESKRAAPAH